jgi:hypothetical protein
MPRTRMSFDELYTGSARKTLALSSIITGIVCKECKSTLPPMTVEDHLTGNFNKTCPHITPEAKKCDLCKGDVVGFGHNPWPLEGNCACDECNFKLVMLARIERITKSKPDVDPRWATVKAAQEPEEKNKNKLKPACDWCGKCSECAKVLRCECRRLCCDVVGGTCDWQMARDSYCKRCATSHDGSDDERREGQIVPATRHVGTGNSVCSGCESFHEGSSESE